MPATKMPRATVTLPSDREILITRTFDAPARLLFEAWTTPEHVRRWYGCEATPMVECEIDLRPGGAWRFVHLDPQGNRHAFYGVYQEIAPPGRLVFTETYEPFPDVAAVNTLPFAERDGRTTLTCLVVHPTRETRDAQINSGMEGGMNEAFDRLEELARTLT